jgi:glycolate oxidase FAD binding subunit
MTAPTTTLSAVGRPGAAGDAVAGVVPARVVEPATLDEAAAIIAASARDGWRLAFAGGGTELGLGAAPEALDVLVRTTALDRVVEHAPLDQIVTVECGVRLGDLQARLGRHGQMLALDPPWAARATVGGVLATSAFGPRRARYGSGRDLVIGMSIVRADGVRARAGGKVVKNVAGFDVPKLMAGSLGTLAFIATATFRLHPLPEATATVLLPGCDVAGVLRIVAAARDAQLEPDAVAVLDGERAGAGSGGDLDLGVRFAGWERAVAQQRERLAGLARGLGLRADVVDAEGEASFWARHQAARETLAAFRAKVALLPADPAFGDVMARLRAPLAAARTVRYPTLGLAFISSSVAADGEDAAAIADAITEARRLAVARGGSVVVHDAPPAVRARVDVWGAPPPERSALPLMRAVKARLDPDRRLAPGRFVGGI